MAITSIFIQYCGMELGEQCVYQMLQHQLQGQRITLNILGWPSHALIHVQRFPSYNTILQSLIYIVKKYLFFINPVNLFG